MVRNHGWIRNIWTFNLNTQTMNYVGQLAGQVFVTVKELYRGLNPATLSGCIDVIVVRQPNGNLQCSPFHVRFGKMGVLRSREKVVDIEINGECVDLHMKLGDNGEAFFVQETENDQEFIPSHLATSPILLEGLTLIEAQLKRNSIDRVRNMDTAGSSQSSATTHTSQSGTENSNLCGSVKKRRRKRRKSKLDSIKRDDNRDTTEEEDMFPIEMSSDEENEPLDHGRPPLHGIYAGEVLERNSSQEGPFGHPAFPHHSDGDWSPHQSKPIRCKGPFPHLTDPADGGLSNSCPQPPSFFPTSDSPLGSRSSTPKSDSELVSKPLDRGMLKNNPQMHWAWGELPQAAKMSTHKTREPNLLNLNLSESTHFRVIQEDSPTSDPPKSFGAPSAEEHVDARVLEEPVYEPQPSPGPEHETQQGPEPAAITITEPDIDPQGAAAPPLSTEEEKTQTAVYPNQPPNKTDSPSKKKDKRSRHLGADGVYLDDLTGMDPEVAALYFPKSGEHLVPGKSGTENGVRSTNQSPQSVGSSGADSGVESISDGIRDLPSIAISLCGGLIDNKEIAKEKFAEQIITYQQFVDNPAVVDDPNLVVKIGNKYYNWPTAAPLLLAMQAFQKPLPKVTVETLMRDKMPKKGGRWWFSWRGRNTTNKVEAKPAQGLPGIGPAAGEPSSQRDLGSRIKDESSSSDEEARAANQSGGSVPPSQSHLPASSGVTYKKTLRLTSDQLKSLKLKNGPNDVVFSVTTQYQGTCRCEGTIYLWNWDDKIVISDIDGTITRSDTLGHILPTLGKDWTHQGIAKLYHKVSENGYKFLYCSARAIGMADMTRGYLHWVNERGTVLPQGPVLLSPSSLFSALHREVIEKKPETFKIQCLTDIKNLFYPNLEPFYAAFGNRPTDVYSYKEVGVSLNRIFTVNPKGELIQEHAKTNISSYVRLCEVVDHVFPFLNRSCSSDFPCSDTFSQFTYWREPLPPFENPDIHPEST
ncbi:phosphatidate phosphatase LPIN1 isoform X1 [Pleurodeles waltl]|uniref:phosphatidate phosphatase LPIN1 isoform X1 n=1 Tax=Pleurodeles waltl TaxID=8319 RepID=UPI0037095468